MRGVSVGVWGGGGEVGGEGGKAGAEDYRDPTGRNCRKQVSFESGFKQRKGRRISEACYYRLFCTAPLQEKFFCFVCLFKLSVCFGLRHRSGFDVLFFRPTW